MYLSACKNAVKSYIAAYMELSLRCSILNRLIGLVVFVRAGRSMGGVQRGEERHLIGAMLYISLFFVCFIYFFVCSIYLYFLCVL